MDLLNTARAVSSLISLFVEIADAVDVCHQIEFNSKLLDVV